MFAYACRCQEVFFSLQLTQQKLESPQRADLQRDQRNDRQIHEPDQARGSEVQEEIQLGHIVFVDHSVTKLQDKPRHDQDA